MSIYIELIKDTKELLKSVKNEEDINLKLQNLAMIFTELNETKRQFEKIEENYFFKGIRFYPFLVLIGGIGIFWIVNYRFRGKKKNG